MHMAYMLKAISKIRFAFVKMISLHALQTNIYLQKTQLNFEQPACKCESATGLVIQLFCKFRLLRREEQQQALSFQAAPFFQTAVGSSCFRPRCVFFFDLCLFFPEKTAQSLLQIHACLSCLFLASKHLATNSALWDSKIFLTLRIFFSTSARDDTQTWGKRAKKIKHKIRQIKIRDQEKIERKKSKNVNAEKLMNFFLGHKSEKFGF